MNNTVQLYIDKEKQIKGYPITSPDRVINKNGVSIKENIDEIIEARDGEETLGAKIRKFNEQLNKIEDKTTDIYYLRDYISDYEINNDLALAKLIHEINNNSNNIKVIFNIPKLYLSKPLTLKRGNIEIDYNNCKFIWENYDNLGASTGVNRNIGIFMFLGEEQEEQIQINYTSYLSSIVYDTFTLKTSTQEVNEGDYLILKLGNNTGVANNDSPITPFIERLVKVVKKIDNTYHIDYKNVWREIIDRYDYGCYVEKTNTLENIIIKNFDYKDITILENATENVNIEYVGRNKNNLVGGLYFYCCSNIQLINIKGVNNTFPLITTFKCNGIYLDGLEVDRPRIIGPGEGYGIQLQQTHNFVIKNVKGNQERHLIDITEGSNGIIDIGNSINTRAFGFSLHGAYEHDIEFRSCTGQFQYGNSGERFGNASKNITYRDCKGRLMGLYCQNLYIDHCDFECDAYGTRDTIIRDSNIIVRAWDGKKEIKPRASRQTNTSIEFHNCKINVPIDSFYTSWSRFRVFGDTINIPIIPLNNWKLKQGVDNCISITGNEVIINFALQNGTYANGTKLFEIPEQFKAITNKDISSPAFLQLSDNSRIVREIYLWLNQVSLYTDILNSPVVHLSGCLRYYIS